MNEHDPHRHGHGHIGDHDWHSREYVDDWIARDVTRDEQRQPILARMLTLAEFPRDAALAVLDVGGGYGVVTEEVLKAFPNAAVTLLDYSEPMLAHARQRLAAHVQRVRIVKADLTAPDWTARAGGPFDLAVSAIAIHNLRETRLIAAAYAGVMRLLKPRGLFLNCDLVAFSGGLDAHLGWLREAGFARVERLWQAEPLAILLAQAP